jgi:hypothetical protein
MDAIRECYEITKAWDALEKKLRSPERPCDTFAARQTLIGWPIFDFRMKAESNPNRRLNTKPNHKTEDGIITLDDKRFLRIHGAIAWGDPNADDPIEKDHAVVIAGEYEDFRMSVRRQFLSSTISPIS